MKNPGNQARVNITGLVASVLFIGVFIYLTIVMGMRSRIEEELRKEKLQSELLLSEKLHQEKKSKNLHEELSGVERKLSVTNCNLDSMVKEINTIKSELATKKYNANSQSLTSQQHETDRLLQQILHDSSEYVHAIESIKSEKEEIEMMLSKSISDNEKYISEIERLNRLRVLDAMIESAKNENKLTVKAARTRIIRLNLVVADQTGDLTFKIIDPSGTELPVDSKNLTLKTEAISSAKTNHVFYVNQDIQVETFVSARKVEMTYRASQKLPPGKYKILFHNADGLSGSLALRIE